MTIKFNEEKLLDYLTKNHELIKATMYNEEYEQRERDARKLLSCMGLGLTFSLKGKAEIYALPYSPTLL